LIDVNKELERVKTRIIKQKLDTIFSFLSSEDSSKLFKENMDDFEYYNKDYNRLLESYQHLFREEAREELIKKKQAQIYGLIQVIKNLVETYAKDGHRDVLSHAMNIQQRELEPEMNNLRMLRWKIMEVEWIVKKSPTKPFSKATAERKATAELKATEEEDTDPDPEYKESLLVQKYAGLQDRQHNIGKPLQVVSFRT
jgi:hypothetical protein